MGVYRIDIGVYEKGKKSPNWNLETDINGGLSFTELAEFTRSALITISKQALKEEQAQGFPKNPLTIVDNKYHAPIESVKAFGKIRFIRQQEMGKVLIEAYESLLIQSPVYRGDYKSTHVVTLNSVTVANSLTSLRRWIDSDPEITDRDKIRITNTRHYAGKLERYGITANRKSIKEGPGKKRKGVIPTVKKPNGAYAVTANRMKSKYGRNFYITFEWRPGSQLGIPKYPNARHEYVYPTILFYIFSSGLANE